MVVSEAGYCLISYGANNMTNNDIPWSFPVAVAKIPEGGLHQELNANPTQLNELAVLAGVLNVTMATASFDVKLAAAERVHVTGHVKAYIEQTCVVTLDPMQTTIDETIDVTFVPPSQIPVTAKVVTSEEGDDAEIPDPPEPIVNGSIDLGRLAAEAVILGIDPYPRKPGAVFDPPNEAVDPDDHPFAALKALKAPPTALKKKKPKEG